MPLELLAQIPLHSFFKSLSNVNGKIFLELPGPIPVYVRIKFLSEIWNIWNMFFEPPGQNPLHCFIKFILKMNGEHSWRFQGKFLQVVSLNLYENIRETNTIHTINRHIRKTNKANKRERKHKNQLNVQTRRI